MPWESQAVTGTWSGPLMGCARPSSRRCPSLCCAPMNAPKRQRPDWDTYFMGFAVAASHRATCDRKHVGAVIVVDKQVVATGYNGSVRGMPHCDEAGHDMEGGHCVRTIH